MVCCGAACRGAVDICIHRKGEGDIEEVEDEGDSVRDESDA